MRPAEQRAAAAHRAAFALVTAALSDPNGFDAEPMLRAYTDESENPGQTILDVAAGLVWHAASAIYTAADEDIDQALALMRRGALMQENKTGEMEND